MNSIKRWFDRVTGVEALMQMRIQHGTIVLKWSEAEKKLNEMTIANSRLEEVMHQQGLTKRQLDEQAAIQLEMDMHRVGMERELIACQKSLALALSKVVELESRDQDLHNRALQLANGMVHTSMQGMSRNRY